MSPEEKKLEKLNALFELVNADFATPDDLIQLSEAILSIITTEKERLNALIEDEKSEDKKEKAEMVALLNAKEQGLKNIINRLSSDTDTAISQATTRLSNEIKRVEKKIPTKTDLSALEADIKALGDGLNSLSTEITANGEAVRDSLELLQDEERLDKSAIKGLDDYEEIAALARSPKTIGNAGVKLLRYLQDVNIEGITNGQTILWNSTLQRFEPGSGGTGGGHTIEDEGTPLTQRTNLNFVGAGVTVTDDAGNDATVVTIDGGGGTVNAYAETPTGLVNSSNTSYTLANTPADTDGVLVLLDGVTQYNGIDYTVSGTTITFTTAPATGSSIFAYYNTFTGGGGGGASAFTDLTDVPASYTGQAGKFPKVNATEDGLEFATISGGGDMLASTYDPQAIAGDAFDTDNHTDGTTNKVFTAIEKTKLAGIETAADVTDATNVAAAGAFMKSVDDTDDITEGVTNKFATASEKTKLGHITVTQAVDLDTIESDTATNNTKVTNATHTGEVTGSGALTIDPTAISGKTLKSTLAGTEQVLINDAGTLKRTTAQDIADLGGGGGGGGISEELAIAYAVAL